MQLLAVACIFYTMGLIKDFVGSAARISTTVAGPINTVSVGDFLQQLSNPKNGNDIGKSATDAFNPAKIMPNAPKRPGLGAMPAGPDRASATLFANQQTSQDMQRRRQSQTLFTSGQGTLDAPLVASAVLLGS